MATIPGLAIMVVVVGFNLFSDSLRDTLDPRLRQEADPAKTNPKRFLSLVFLCLGGEEISDQSWETFRVRP